MPIRPYLDGHRFDAETTRLMGLAFETAIQALRNWGLDDPASPGNSGSHHRFGEIRRTGPGPSLRSRFGRMLHQRPQSSSASRFTAGASGFLNFSQSGERPDR